MSDGTCRLTDTEWREYQNIPEQGYSHRDWIDHKIAERLQAAAAEHQIRAKRIWDSGYEAGIRNADHRLRLALEILDGQFQPTDRIGDLHAAMKRALRGDL